MNGQVEPGLLLNESGSGQCGSFANLFMFASFQWDSVSIRYDRSSGAEHLILKC